MIFEFKDSTRFLKAYVRSLPNEGFGEAKRMATYLRVTPTYISQILAGSKTLTLEQGLALAAYLGLSAIEQDYFLLLIQLERAGTSELKKYFGARVEDARRESQKLVNRVEAKRVLSEEEKSVFYSAAVYSAIHLYCATGEAGRTADELAERFDLPRAKVLEYLRFLVDSQLCVENGARFKTGTHSTHLEQGSPHLLKHYSNWRLRSIAASENLADEELMYTLNVAVSREDFTLLRERTAQFIQDFLAQAYPSPSEEIACLNLDWFWIR